MDMPVEGHIKQHSRFSAMDENLRDGKPLPIISAGQLREADSVLGLGAVVDSQGRIIGEATMIDGEISCTGRDGVRQPLQKGMYLSFAQFANMVPDGSVSAKISANSPDDLIAQCQQLLPESERQGFVMQIDGDFSSITYRGMGDAAKCYSSLDEVIADERQFPTSGHARLSGVFQHKQLPNGYAPPGWHFHGLHTDGNHGGHIIDFAGFNGKVTVMPVREWQVLRSQKNRTEIYRPNCDGQCR